MENKLKGYNIRLLLVIIGIANCGAYHFLSAAALGGMKLDPVFAGVSDTMLQQIPSLPSLFVVPGALLLPFMTRFTSRKKLALVGALAMFVSGILPAFVTNMSIILFGRAVGGFAMGYMIPIGMTLIYENFTGDAKKNATAWYNMSGALITGVFLQALNGVLAGIDWRLVYASYSIYFIIFILIIFYMDDLGKETKKETGGPTFVITGAIILFGLMTAFNKLLVRVLVNNMSMLIKIEGTGNMAVMGTAMSMMTLGSVLMGLLFAAFSKRLKGATRAFGTALIAIGLFVIFKGYDSNTAPIIGAAILGTGTMLNMSANMLSVAAHVPKTALTGAMVTYQIFYNVGQYSSPIVVNTITPIIGDAIRDRFLFGAIVSLGLAVIYFVIQKVDKKTYEEDSESKEQLAS